MFAIPKRIFLFILTNILVVATLSITIQLVSRFLGVEIDPNSYSGLLIFCSIFGMGGAFISLFISKWMAKRSMGVQVIDPQRATGTERELVDMVYNLAKKAKLPKMPEVGVYNAPEVNAFATGPSKSNSLVAVSTGLLNRMNKDQVEGVIGHEIAHIANGDMVTMTLVQGIINTFVMFLARIIANIIVSQMSGDRDNGRGNPFMYMGIVFALDMLFSILGSIVVTWFSRLREYRADIGGAKYAGRDKMISALKALGGTEEFVDSEHKAFASLKISGRRRPSSIAQLFMTHPPLEDRIRRLERARIS